MIRSNVINKANHNLGASINIKAKALELRKSMTVQEKILWRYLRNRQIQGKHFRRQHPYGIYILDFYCFEANLAIEVDGPIHQNHEQYDKERTEYLESSGMKGLRFDNDDVETRIEWVLSKITSILTEIKSSRVVSHMQEKAFPPWGKRERG
jgi:very-short-patch-repair endonuclease